MIIDYLKQDNEKLRNSNNELEEKLKDNFNHESFRNIQRKLESEIEEWKQRYDAQRNELIKTMQSLQKTYESRK